jgi:hypothetical protein
MMSHRSCIRLRTTYGSDDEGPTLPDDYDPLAELDFVTRAARLLLGMPGAIGYFNPGGESLRDAQFLEDAIDYADKEGVPPLDIWINVRLFDAGQGWRLMDTVGNAQLSRPGLELPDVEACLPPDGNDDPQDVDGFLRSVTLYLLEKGNVFQEGDTIGGPGDVAWVAHQRSHGLVVPPRPTIRFVPQAAKEIPANILADLSEPAG